MGFKMEFCVWNYLNYEIICSYFLWKEKENFLMGEVRVKVNNELRDGINDWVKILFVL